MQQASQTPSAPNPNLVDRYLPDDGNYYEAPTGGSFLSMAAIRAILWRQKLVLICVTGLVVVLGLVATMLMTPIYDATATVRVNNQGQEIIEGAELDPYISTNELSTHLNTLSGVISSRSMALAVVDSLDLVEKQIAQADADDAPMTPEERRMALAGYLSGSVDVEVLDNSRIMAISFSSDDREFAAQVANAYAENFLASSLLQGVEANSYAREYLEEQIADTREKLREAELAAIGYARSNRIIAQPLVNGAGSSAEESGASGTAPTMTVENLSSINSSVMSARAARIAAEERWRAVANVPALQLPEVRDNQTVQSLQARIAEAEARRTSLSERYQADYPEVRELTTEIAALRQQIASAAAQIKNSIRDSYTIANRQEAALSRELQSVSDQTLNEQDRRVQYNLLEREAQAFRTQLEVMLFRFNQLAAASNIRSSDVSLLDRATVPLAPSSPNLMKNLAAALLLGLGLAAAIAVLREALDDKLRSTEDVERKLGARILGQTPYISEQVPDEIANFFSPISEAYSSLRATLDYRLANVTNPVVLFTSSQSSEGKTTSAVAVARKYAAIGRKTLLIDMDMRRPAVSGHFFDSRPKTGVVEAIYMHVPLDQAIVNNVEQNLDVLPVGAIPDNPAEILSSGLVNEMLAKCRAQYDVVVIDSSPVMGIADAPLLSRFVDGVIFIVEANKAQASQARQAISRLRDMNANLLGVVLTKYRALDAGESYDYQYRYYSYDTKSD